MQTNLQLHCKCTNFNSATRITVHSECIYVFLSKSCPRLWISCWFNVDKHCCDVCCDKFPVPQIDRRSKQVTEQWHEKFYLQSVWGKTRYFKHWKYRNLWMNNKGRGDKNAICLHFSISAEYLQIICIFNFPRYCSNMPKMRRVISYGFCSKFRTLSNSVKFWKSVIIWQSYRELKGGNIFWDTV